MLSELRERPAGTIRITTSEQAAETILWPALDRLLSKYPDIHVEPTSIPVSLISSRREYDAGVQLGEQLQQDMIAVRIGPRLRMAAVASPAYFKKRGIPQTPRDLAAHSCINLRMASAGGLRQFEKNGRALTIRVEGQLVLNHINLILEAAIAGHGVAFLIEDKAAKLVRQRKLVRVLEDWCPPFDGYHLYYPSRKQPSHAFGVLLDALRYRG